MGGGGGGGRSCGLGRLHEPLEDAELGTGEAAWLAALEAARELAWLWLEAGGTLEALSRSVTG